MLWTAFILGLFSSVHCVGMCGPIVLMLPYSQETRRKMLVETFTYHLGRVTIYSILGLLFGFLGRGLALAGLQQSLSVLFGVLLMVLAVFSYNYENRLASIGIFKKANEQVRRGFSYFLKKKNAHFILGMLNGLLPCGMVYWAIAASMLTFSLTKGALYMALFGLGTMPLLIGTLVASSFFKKQAIRQFYQLVPFYQFALGVFLIWRAYAIDPSVLDYLSPVPVCH